MIFLTEQFLRLKTRNIKILTILRSNVTIDVTRRDPLVIGHLIGDLWLLIPLGGGGVGHYYLKRKSGSNE